MFKISRMQNMTGTKEKFNIKILLQRIKDTEKEIVCFFCDGSSAQVSAGNHYGVYEESVVDMGLGMNPELIGWGKGMEFGSFVFNSIEESHKRFPIQLTVTSFNKRAIRLYEGQGFVQEKRFSMTRQNLLLW